MWMNWQMAKGKSKRRCSCVLSRDWAFSP